MQTITFNLQRAFGKFKPLNATNGGPSHKRHAKDQYRSNYTAYKQARIPYSRNHDSNACGVYGGPYAHDITAIFPDFNADENDPNSYDFACTDESILCTLEAGTKTYFRLGQTIEHQIKKHGTIPPKDFSKWARICEHIIRHYTEGWANGFTHDMPYWEIWNEPDLDDEDSPNKRCWGGTKAQFFDLYEITAKHLKSCFPHLKIGGPGLARNHEWAEEFLSEMQKRKTPIDFFSWHVYSLDTAWIIRKSYIIREMLDKYGFTQTESHLNEWNYVKGWTDEFIYTLESIHSIKGASFLMSIICEAQKTPIDMLMYYDTRVGSTFNGAFDFYTLRPLKGYYPLKWYGEFYDLENEVRAENSIEDIYTLCGVDKDGKITAIVSRFSDDDTKENTKLKIDFGKNAQFDIFLLDKDHDGELVKTTADIILDMPVHSCVLIKEK